MSGSASSTIPRRLHRPLTASLRASHPNRADGADAPPLTGTPTRFDGLSPPCVIRPTPQAATDGCHGGTCAAFAFCTPPTEAANASSCRRRFCCALRSRQAAGLVAAIASPCPVARRSCAPSHPDQPNRTGHGIHPPARVAAVSRGHGYAITARQSFGLQPASGPTSVRLDAAATLRLSPPRPASCVP